MSCFFCKGDLVAGTKNHMVSFKECIIIVKNVPCSLCSQCGESFYDDNVASQLEKIVNKMRDAATEIAVINYSDKVA